MSETPKPPGGGESWLDYLLNDGPYAGCGDDLDEMFAACRAELAALRAERDKWRGLWGPYSYEIASAFLNNCDCAQCATSIIDRPDRFEIYCHDCSERGEAAVSALRAERDALQKRLDALLAAMPKSWTEP